jgi:amino acid transporter
MASNDRQRVDRLRAGSIGLPHVLFQSVTHMAPAVSLAFVFFVAVSFAGPALPLALVLAVTAVLCVASSVGQLAREMPSAGGLYSYTANALGPKVGFVIGWAFMLIEPFVTPLLLLLGAFLLQDVFANDIGWDTGWVPWVLIGAVLVFLLAYRDIRLSTSAGIALGAFEIGIFLLLAVWIILSAGGENTLAVFDPTNAEAGTWEGTFKGVVFAVAALIGFESAAPLGEEARNPRWTIPRALLLSALAIGLFYIITSYAWVVGTGFEEFTKTTLESANPIRTLAEDYWGWGWWLVFIALINGVLANGNAALNTSSRIAYALSRARAIPSAFARTHPRFRTPHVAIVAQVLAGTVAALLLGWKWDPLTGLTILGTAIGITILAVYITVCVATIAFFWRRRRERFHPWLHGVIPAVGAVFFLVPLYYQYRPLPDYPLRWANWIAPVWLAIGIALSAWLAVRKPEVLANAERIYEQEEAEREIEPGFIHPEPGRPGLAR